MTTDNAWTCLWLAIAIVPGDAAYFRSGARRRPLRFARAIHGPQG